MPGPFRAGDHNLEELTVTGNMRIIEVEAGKTSGVYPKRDLAIVKGEGVYLYDEHGRKYIDCVSGHGVANLGHCHPTISGALEQQSRELVTCSEVLYTPRRGELYERLSSVLPTSMNRFFLCNSGTEAVEGAFKFARIATGRTKILALQRGFHGRSLGALAATWNPRFRKGFESLLDQVDHIPLNDIEAANSNIDETVAAVIVEPVQGEGGVRPLSQDFMEALRARCDEAGSLLIIDEVQTGFGRTGRLFAFEHFGIEPDLLCLGKALAGGIPMGAIVLGERVGQLPKSMHGSTFGGNPLACAAALASLNVLQEEGLIENANVMGRYLRACLEALESPLIREVRGLGLMCGVDLRVKATPVLKQMQKLGVLALPAGPTVVRLLPPLTVGQTQLDIVVRSLDTALTKLTKGAGGP